MASGAAGMGTKVKPIGPDEIEIALPDFVMEAINDLIRKRYRGGSFILNRSEIEERIKQLSPNPMKKNEIFDNKYLDFEEVYRQAGWKVKSFQEYFKFEPR